METQPPPARILVADDEFGMRDGCRKLLEGEGYAVDTAADGQAALERFRQAGGYDVVLVDLKMPCLGGLELIDRLHALDPHAGLLVITGFATIQTAVEATKRGAYGYVPKPFTPEELLIPLRNVLERRALALEADRLRAERENRLLEAARERSQGRTILQCLADGVLVVNRERQVVLCNQAAADIFPALAGNALPAPMARLGQAPLQALLEDTLAAKTLPVILSRELSLGAAIFMANASPVVDEARTVLGAVAVLRDITARKRLEDEKSRFVSMVAHEVKGPLAAVEGYLALLLGGDPARWPESDRAMLDRALQRTRTLRMLVGELMTLRAVESGRLALTRTPLDLRALLGECLAAFRDRAAARRVTLALDLAAADPLTVLGDPTALRTIFADLLDNALKYTPAGGSVAVRAAREGAHAVVAVRDTGIGVAPEDAARLFEEFFRVRSEATAAIPGTGLGLSIVKRLVDLHQGAVAVRSALGQGSTFSVSLPALATGDGHGGLPWPAHPDEPSPQAGSAVAGGAPV